MKKEKNKFTYIWLSCLLLMLSFGFIGTNIAVKKTYSAGSNCYIYNGKTECLDLDDYTVYGKYSFPEPDKGRFQWHKWEVKFKALGAKNSLTSVVFDKIEIRTGLLGMGYTHLYFISGEKEYKVATRLSGGGFNEDWRMVDDDNFGSLQIYVIEPTTFSKGDYEDFEDYTNPYTSCQYNESSDKFLWTNVEIGRPLIRYGVGHVGSASACSNKRVVILNDSTDNIKINGVSTPHYYYLDDGDEANINKYYTELNKNSNIVRDGYKLSWNTRADGSGTSYGHATSFTVTKNIKLYAIWKSDNYIVEYDANGGTNAPNYQIKEYNKKLTLRGKTTSELPTRSCYKFNSWNTKADGSGTKYAAGASYDVNAGLKLYAQWDLETYGVYYNANGGINAPKSQTKYCGQELRLAGTFPTPADSCHIFNSWNTKADGKGTKYGILGSYKENKNLSLYAQWALITYEVKYDANGGTNAPAKTSKECGKRLLLSSQEPIKDGYTFIGWSTSKDGNVKYDAGSYYYDDDDVVLYAKWMKGDNLSRCNIRDNPPTSDKMLVSIGLMILTFVGFAYCCLIIKRVKD